ncbi:MAG: MarR family transcriptional regulator [Rhizobium sp.]|nr:MarR family transcriptional regulator [Rhizobium sp.]
MSKKDKSRKKDKPDKESPSREPGNLQSEVTRAARFMRTFLTNSLSHSGVYAGQDGVILALAEEDGLSAGAIAERLGVKPPTMTRTLARMEAQGFIERQADELDGRQMRAVLTDGGRKHVQAIQLAVKGTENLAIAGLSDKEVRQFLKVLRKINRNLGQVEPDAEAFAD